MATLNVYKFYYGDENSLVTIEDGENKIILYNQMSTLTQREEREYELVLTHQAKGEDDSEFLPNILKPVYEKVHNHVIKKLQVCRGDKIMVEFENVVCGYRLINSNPSADRTIDYANRWQERLEFMFV